MKIEIRKFELPGSKFKIIFPENFGEFPKIVLILNLCYLILNREFETFYSTCSKIRKQI